MAYLRHARVSKETYVYGKRDLLILAYLCAVFFLVVRSEKCTWFRG